VGQDSGVRDRRDANVELERLYREEGAKLWRSLVAYGGDREVASDAVAEAFARALARQGQIYAPLPWIWRTAFRIAAAELRTRGRTKYPPAEGVYEMPEPLADMLRGLARLSPNQRAAVILHDYADRPTDEVAKALGASAATVRVHLSQGRRRLRAFLEERDA
jgi:RNA polymerase sigma factor (sigma-70 family)